MLNKIICGNCLEVIENIPDLMLDCTIIDPPYGENMGFEGDECISSAEYLLGVFLKKVEPKIIRNGHVCIFWTFRNLDVCLDVLRSSGFMYRRTLAMYIPKGGARPYLGWLPRTQAIVIAQKYLPKQPTEFHTDLAKYLSEALFKSELTRNQIAKQLGCNSRLVMKWTRVGDPAYCLPTPRFYKPLKNILNLDNTFDILLTRESNAISQRNDFEYKHDCYIVDNKNEEMLHPSQKPLSVLEHVVQCLCPKDGIVLDAFCGSGTICVAAKNTGRNFIGIEISEEYCKIANKRLM